MLQNLVLVGCIAYLFRGAMKAEAAKVSALCYALAAGFLFVLLEEVDYGLHFLEYFGVIESSLQPDSWSRNIHNRSTSSGVQYGSYMKTAATAILAVGFLMAPFVLRNSRFAIVRLFTPSRWAAATVLLIAVLSRIAHLLDNAGLSQIDGAPGNLEYNISEFRELNMYYLFLLYFAELHQRLAEPIRKRSNRS
jgi:hypothetical protein